MSNNLNRLNFFNAVALLGCMVFASTLQASQSNTSNLPYSLHQETVKVNLNTASNTNSNTYKMSDVQGEIGINTRINNIPKAMYKDGMFSNLYEPEASVATETSPNWLAFLKIFWEKLWQKQPDYAFEMLPVSSDILSNSNKPSVTWLGHATVLFQLNGLNILTDPMFSERASPVSWAGPKRLQPPPIAITDLPKIDTVLISHDHYDHLDKASIEMLAKQSVGQPKFLVGMGLKSWMIDRGVLPENVQEFNWGDRTSYRNVAFSFLPAQHWSKRSLFSKNQNLWGSWMISDLLAANPLVTLKQINQTNQSNQPIKHPCQYYFAGDTAYAPHFKLISQAFSNEFNKIDVAAIPVGAYEPRANFKKHHINPDDAAQASLDLQANISIGIHWAAFNMGFEDQTQTPKLLALAKQKLGIPESAFRLPKQGQSMWLGCGRYGYGQ